MPIRHAERNRAEHGLLVTLVQPRVPAASAFERLGRSHLPPLGLLYVAASLQRAGHRVRAFDLNLELPEATLLRQVRRERPEVVALGTLAPAFAGTLALARRLRRVMAPGALLLAGGPDVTTQPARYAQSGLFDALLLGEAEHTAVALCAAWPRVPRGVAGILPRGDDPAACPLPAKVAPDAVALPARELLPLRRYRGGPAFKRRRHSTSIFTHRGCPYRCTFCEKGVHEGPVRLRSAEGILEEVRRVRRDHGIHDIRFIDDVFLVSRPVLEAFVEAVLRSGERFHWLSTARVDLVDLPLLTKMRRAGCYRLEYGVESGSERILALINKRIDLSTAERALRLTRQAGIESIANFILGFPGESEAEMERTIAASLALDPDYAVYFAFFPFSRAPITLAHRAGELPGPEVPPERVSRLVARAYARFYFRPAVVGRRLAARPSPWVVWDLARMAAAFPAHLLRGQR